MDYLKELDVTLRPSIRNLSDDLGWSNDDRNESNVLYAHVLNNSTPRLLIDQLTQSKRQEQHVAPLNA